MLKGSPGWCLHPARREGLSLMWSERHLLLIISVLFASSMAVASNKF